MDDGATAENKTDLYKFYSKSGEILYVGISLNAAIRMSQHKGYQPWWHEVSKVEIDRYENRFLAQQAEQNEILKLRPKYNIHYNCRTNGCAELTDYQILEQEKKEERYYFLLKSFLNRPLLSVNEAAEIIGSTIKHITEEIEGGGLRAICIPFGGRGGTRIRVTSWDLLDYLDKLVIK